MDTQTAFLADVVAFLEAMKTGDVAYRCDTDRYDGTYRGVLRDFNDLAASRQQLQLKELAAETQTTDVIDFVMTLASLDFAKRLSVSGKNDQNAAMATGLNMLAEELHHTTVSRQSLALALDLAEQRSAELELANKKLIDMQVKLIQASKMAALGEMAGGVAHEINTPLAVILGRCQQLKRLLAQPGVDGTRAKELAEIVAAMADRIAVIVRGLRAFTRNSEADPLKHASLSVIIADAAALCSERCRNHGIDLRLAEAGPLTIECQSPQISQVLLNLLSNAHDAVENLPTKWIHIGIVDLGAEVAISVTDSGSGIPAAVQAKLMQPFFTTKDIDKGTGLGLSISKGLVEQLGGTLRLDPTAPHTRFVMTLPKTQSARQKPRVG